ncbi:hypothetical protein [Sphingobacterium faecale]|uniref:DUF3575 domain-containing protein n=1 Tax=Sphingobacterium faecale TaxID=2803775 RepID=A0ABS1R6P3_9SPHI|nr:hypothetical protein [Sphingobacterium faecale]MBL1409672.1 hypothetical protein [Sphingobacterium faecale]
MKGLFITLKILILSTLVSNAQINYSGRFETGYQHYLFRTLTVDPSPNWKGYNLDKKQNAFSLTSVNGLTFNDTKLFTGIGLGYLNFESISGVSIFGDFEYLTSKSRMTPLFHLKLGYNHIWNQYEGGKGTMLTEFGLGLNCKLNEKFGVHIKSGIHIVQQSFLIPITLGFRY